MARTGWGRHTVVATGSNDSTKQVSVNAWNNDLDTDGIIGFTPETVASASSITPTNSFVKLSGSTSVDTIALANSSDGDLLYVITTGSVTLNNTSSPSSDGDIRLLGDENKDLSTTTPTILIRNGVYWYEYGGSPVTDESITFAKIQNIGTMKTVGRTAAGSGVSSEVTILDSDTMSGASDTTLATSESIKEYVDNNVSSVTASSTTTFENKTVDLADNTLTGSVAEFNTALQSESFATLGGTETLVSKTLTSPIVNTQITGTAILDSDTMSGASATTLATSESIKAYVDDTITAEDLDITDGTTAGSVDLNSQSLTFTSGEGIDATVSSQTLTIAAEDATTSNKGIASFATTEFNVSSGAVSVGTIAEAKVTGLTTALGTKAPLASPTFTGTVAIPNYANVETTLDGIATNATAVALRAPLANPTFTGTVTADNITATGTVTCDVTGDVSGSAATATTAAGLSATLAVASGGTYISSYAAGDLLYATGATTLAKLAKGTGSQTLKMNSGATAPEWVTVTSGADTPWDVVHNFADYYYDMEVQTKPADPSADHGRFYVKEIDTNNDGVFCIIRKNGGFEETQIV